MGISNSIHEEEESGQIQILSERLRILKLEMNTFQKRLAGVERDVATATRVAQDNKNALLNLSLLEEGRSVYRRGKRHVGSSYN